MERVLFSLLVLLLFSVFLHNGEATGLFRFAIFSRFYPPRNLPAWTQANICPRLCCARQTYNNPQALTDQSLQALGKVLRTYLSKTLDKMTSSPHYVIR